MTQQTGSQRTVCESVFGSDFMRIEGRECHAYECPNNDLYVSKVNHLFDEIVCELQAFVINSTGYLKKIPLDVFSFRGVV